MKFGDKNKEGTKNLFSGSKDGQSSSNNMPAPSGGNRFAVAGSGDGNKAPSGVNESTESRDPGAGMFGKSGFGNSGLPKTMSAPSQNALPSQNKLFGSGGFRIGNNNNSSGGDNKNSEGDNNNKPSGGMLFSSMVGGGGESKGFGLQSTGNSFSGKYWRKQSRVLSDKNIYT